MYIFLCKKSKSIKKGYLYEFSYVFWGRMCHWNLCHRMYKGTASPHCDTSDGGSTDVVDGRISDKFYKWTYPLLSENL